MRIRFLGTLSLALSYLIGTAAGAQEKLPPPGKTGTGKPSTTAPSSTKSPAATAPKTGTQPAVGGSTKPGGANSGTRATGAGATANSKAGSGGAAAGGGEAVATGASGVNQQTRDLASYAIGLDVAARFQADGMQINPEMLLQGLKDGFAGGKPRYTEDKLRVAADAFEKEMQALAQQRFKEIAQKNKEDGEVYLAENKKKKSVKTLASGLQYEVIKSGTGKSPKTSDKIRAHYHGTLVDGTVFDTTMNEQPIEIDVQGAIPGWTEVLPLMKTGDKWRLFVPPELAYGTEGFGPVPPNAVLIFELELIEVMAPAAQNSAKPATPGSSTKK